MDADELLEANDQFFVGNFEKSAELADVTAGGEALAARAALAAGKTEKIRGLQHSEIPSLRAIAVFHVFANAPAQRAAALTKLEEISRSTRDPISLYLHGCALAILGRSIEALNLEIGKSEDLHALKIQIALLAERSDLAAKISGDLARADSSAAKFGQGLAAIANGRADEAYLCFNDLGNQFDAEENPGIAGARGAANLCRRLWSEALEDSELVLKKFPGHQECLVNAACAAYRMGRAADAGNFLRSLPGDHPLISRGPKSVEEACSRFANSVRP